MMKDYAIIPLPRNIQYGQGKFQCSGIPRIAAGGAYQNEAKVVTGQIAQTLGDMKGPECVRLIQSDKPAGAESYRLEILEDEIRITASGGAGAFRGLQTARQLVLSGYNDGELLIPCGIIEDSPCFSWRGLMLDCSRNFFSVGFIKKLLDALSLQHINIFHWHLTDDQGWRLPVKQYPLLTEIGGKRYDTRIHRYVSGFYSEEEIKEIVSYAAERHIEVVPEVDLPGHANAILSAYPGLGCTGGPYRVEDRYGIFEDVLCAGNDDIFPLAEAVFDILTQLFPSKYVHIGGDEVRFNHWKECPKCRKRLADLGLSEPPQLQSWITARLADMLRQRGKAAIGWDEILENTEQFPLPDDVVVQSWRGEEGGNRAVALGRRVIMSPKNRGCYLDYRHADLAEEIGRLGIGTITESFNLNPITPEMDERAASLVLGGQGNCWAEAIYAGKIAEYLIFPRICAIGEALWSAKKDRDIEEFAKRLAIHQLRLDKLGLLQYRGPL